MPLVYEMGTMHKLNPGFISSHKPLLFLAFRVSFIFSLFAFITSLSREIIKDIEDHRGDKATGGATMPIVWGVLPSKISAFFLLLITSILLSFVVYNTIKAHRILVSVNTLYIFFALIVPLMLLALYVLKATEHKHFKNASLFLKFIMLAGLGYSFIFYYT
jgi:4-hydroxybenzoate polyprenyltransferase